MRVIVSTGTHQQGCLKIMYRRTARLAAAFFAGVLAIVLLPLTISAAPAGAEEQFTLDLIEGELLIRDAAEPHALGSPTSISGINSDGSLSGVEFVTPRVTIVQDVPAYNTTATINADFSTIEPGTGSINSAGDVTIEVSVAVDLHIVVPILAGATDCRSAPIHLTLVSTAPYDGERVTLTAPNFSIPAAPYTGGCNALVGGEVNEALAGAGHSLTMTMGGSLTVPTEGEPTATTLVASPPTGTAKVGDDVTLTATVAADPEVPGAPPLTGTVTFFDGSTILGSSPVDVSGSAQIVTNALAAGNRTLRAAYSGAAPDWDPSSATMTYAVIAAPLMTTTASGTVIPGGTPRPLDVTVVNTGFGGALNDPQVKVTIRRTSGFASIGPDGASPRVTLSRVGSGPAVPVELSYSASTRTLSGVVGDASTWALAAGAEHTEPLELAIAAGTDPGPLEVTFTLVTGTTEGPVEEAVARGTITIVPSSRQPTTISAGDPGFPPFIPEMPPVTPVVRQGNVLEILALNVGPTLGGHAPTGTYTVLIDGIPMQVLHNSAVHSNRNVWRDTVPVGSGTVLGKVPGNIPTGPRQVTVLYSGDVVFAPSQASWTVTVEPLIGRVYECVMQGVVSTPFTANVEVAPGLPSLWAAGQDLPVDRVDLRIRSSRTQAQQEAITSLLAPNRANEKVELEIGDGTGRITYEGVERIDNEAMTPGDGLGIDSIVDLNGGTGILAVDHAPGTSLDYEVGTITVTATTNGFLGGIVCTPAPTAVSLGSVTAAGTTLTVEPSAVIGVGREVTLTAIALPVAPGVMEFRDGTTTIGVVPVDATGTARMAASLPAGLRNLNARFFGGSVATSPSPAVELRVVGDCAAALDPGNGAAVRLVYMELLGRCPDAGGYAYWKAQLDSGAASRGQFARQISLSLEARGVIVDDAYRLMLNRGAEPSGRDFWARRLANGRFDDLLADLASSPEFWTQAGRTNEGFVTLVYERILRRSPESDGLVYWVGRLDAGASRRQLVRTLFNLPEPLSVVVNDAYHRLIDRDPSTAEHDAGVALMRASSNRSRLYAVVIDTDDFFDRAQSFPERA